MKYRLACKITVSAYTEVEADSLEDAIQESKERQGALDFNGSGSSATESWLVEEVAGEPFDIIEA